MIDLFKVIASEGHWANLHKEKKEQIHQLYLDRERGYQSYLLFELFYQDFFSSIKFFRSDN